MGEHALVIIGAGQAGFQAAVSARAAGYGGTITVVGAEQHEPYQRPPLSKAYLLGKLEASSLALQRPDFYARKGICILTNTTVMSIDRDRCEVVLSDGSCRSYTHLILATGARSRALGIRGETLEGVHYLRDLNDAQALRQNILQASTAAVIGGGFIGLEFAAVAREKGLTVTVFEAADRLMARIASPLLSKYFLDLHTSKGVRVLLGASVEEIAGRAGHVCGVRVQGAEIEAADVVVVGAGAIPNSELAQRCGLSGPGAVQVDAFLRTEDHRILAIGDCAAYQMQEQYLRLESVQNAVEQGKHSARTIMGDLQSYSAIPWFWSDQFGAKLQIAGLVRQADEQILRGNTDAGKFSIFSFLGGVLQGVESVNSPGDHVMARKLLSHPRAITPQEVRDSSVDIRALMNERMSTVSPTLTV